MPRHEGPQRPEPDSEQLEVALESGGRDRLCSSPTFLDFHPPYGIRNFYPIPDSHLVQA
jgi:hypothetical protein